MPKSKAVKTPPYLTTLWPNLPATWRSEFGPMIDEGAVKATIAYGKKAGTAVALSFAAHARKAGYLEAECAAIIASTGKTGQHINELRNGLASGRITMLAGTIEAHGTMYTGKASLPGGRKAMSLVKVVKLPAKASTKAKGGKAKAKATTTKAKAKQALSEGVAPVVTAPSAKAQAKLTKVTGQPIA